MTLCKLQGQVPFSPLVHSNANKNVFKKWQILILSLYYPTSCKGVKILYDQLYHSTWDFYFSH